MNTKAERIEQIIQIVSRNLALILSHETDSLTPLDTSELQKVDMGVFSHDKFAFEMSHFVKSERIQAGHKMTALWEWNFLKGLETLLVEAAVVTDEIERDCFISRIYCWYNEKLLERKDLPRGPITKKGLAELSHTLESMGSAHSAKAMANLADKRGDEGEEEDLHGDEHIDNDDRKISKYTEPGRPVSANQAPLYVKHSYPDVMKPSSASEIIRSGVVPAVNVPDSTNNYGMLYHKPDTQSETQMHDLWVAKRRQEAFDWKTQQHLAVVMDRLAVHKSRMETDALRRQESGNFMMENKSRPGSGSGDPNTRFVMQTRRPMSGRQRQLASLSTFDTTIDQMGTASAGKEMRAASGDGPPSVVIEEKSLEQFSIDDFAPDFSGGLEDLAVKHDILLGEDDSFEGVAWNSSLEDDTSVVVKGEDDEEIKIPKMGRSQVTKKPKDEGKRHVIPMRYGDSKISQPTISRLKLGQQHELIDYMYDDGEEEDSGFKLPSIKTFEKVDTASGSLGGTVQGQPSPAKKKKPAKSAGAANKGPVRKFVEIREKAQSTKKLKEVSYNDLELKIFDRHVNVRRMPLTEEAEKWLNDKENERVKAYSEKVQKLKEDFAAKNAKSKDKGGEKKDAKKDKKKVAEEPPPVIPKYKSASQFMSIHFPVFDSYRQTENMGPMRAQQMNECQRIIEVFEQAGINIDPECVYKGLMIPQDRPESICIENLREGLEGLMLNPLPKEFWRKELAPLKKGGGKKGKKKK